MYALQPIEIPAVDLGIRARKITMFSWRLPFDARVEPLFRDFDGGEQAGHVDRIGIGEECRCLARLMWMAKPARSVREPSCTK